MAWPRLIGTKHIFLCRIKMGEEMNRFASYAAGEGSGFEAVTR